MNMLLVWIVCFAIFIALALPARAQSVCVSAPEMIEFLGKKHGESPIWQGINHSGQLVQVWTNPETGTFTIIMVLPTGISCFGTAGAQWETLPPPPPGSGS